MQPDSLQIGSFVLNTTGIVTTVTQFSMRLIGVLVFLLLAKWIAGRLGKMAQRGIEKKSDPTVARFVGGLIRVGIMVLAIVSCLRIFGIETTSFAAVLASAGLAVGLAFQGTLSSFSAGIMLLVFRPFKVGDVISVGGNVGSVFTIDLFTTTLDTPDNRRLILPNSSVFGNTIENVTWHPTRRVGVDVGVEYSASVDRTREVLLAAAGKVSGLLLDPAPVAVLTDLGDSSVNWQVRVWCNTGDFWGVKEALTRQIKLDLDEAGIGIPFPQMEVHLDKNAG